MTEYVIINVVAFEVVVIFNAEDAASAREYFDECEFEYPSSYRLYTAGALNKK